MPPIFGEPEPTPPPPAPMLGDTCEETDNRIIEESNYCSLRYDCDGDELEATCSWVDDHWDCRCDGDYFREQYELVGPDLTGACPTLVDLCFSGSATSFDGDRECDETRVQGADSCEVLERCRVSADLGDGVKASQVVQTDFVNCDGDESSLLCSCQVGFFGRGMVLTGAAPDDGCDLMFDVCSSEGLDAFAATGECERTHRRQESTVCEASERCSLMADAGDGVTAEAWTDHNINCRDIGEEDWECRCNGSSTAIFSWPVAATPEETCNGALDLCAETGQLPKTEPTQTVTQCDDDFSPTSGGNHCDRGALCRTDVEVSGVDVELESFLNTSCYQSGDQQFECTCSGWSTLVTIEHTSSAALSEVCLEVFPECEAMAAIELDSF